ELEAAAFSWLSDFVEDSLRVRGRPATGPVLAASVQADTRFLAVVALYQQRPDVDIDAIVREILSAWSVPDHPFHTYTESGLTKYRSWEHLWNVQRLRDAGEDVLDVPIPSEYSQGSRGKPRDFLRDQYWRLRGSLDF